VFRSLLAAGLAVVLLAPAPAWARAKPSFAPPPSWADIAPVPAPPPGDAPAVQTLLDDNQSRLTPQGDSYFNRRIWKIRKAEGLARFTSLGMSWDPESEDVAFHWIRVIRDGKTLDLLQNGRKMLVLRRERGLEAAMLDGRMTASQQLEGLQVGDIIDYAYTHADRHPIAQGRSYDMEGLSFAGVAARYRVRLSWPQTAKLHWKATAGFGEPAVTNRDGMTWLDVDVANAKAPDPPVGAPPRFRRLGVLETTGFENWREVSSLMAPHFLKAAELKKGSPLKAEAAAIAAATSDPKARAFAALQLVEDKTRYFFIGLGDGGYVPAAADLTWERKFGDCKGKTVLLLALLNELGVEAEPALVSLGGGDGLNERPPSLGAFNHVIVRAVIGGKVYWLDGTRTGDKTGIEVLKPPPHKWALPLRVAGSDLEPIVVPPLKDPQMEALVRVDASRGIDAPAAIRMTMRVTGDVANGMRQLLTNDSRAQLERQFRQSMSGGVNATKVETVDWRDDPEHDAFTMEMSGTTELNWLKNPDLGAREFKVAAAPGGAGTTGGGFPRREPGPNQDAPFLVPFPFYIKAVSEIVLPGGGKGFTVRGPNDAETVGAMELKRSSTIAGGVARFVVEARALAPEISAAEAEAANKAYRRMAGEESFVRAPL
jgi:hypothetical protein